MLSASFKKGEKVSQVLRSVEGYIQLRNRMPGDEIVISSQAYRTLRNAMDTHQVKLYDGFIPYNGYRLVNYDA